MRGWLQKQASLYGAENVMACSYTKTAAKELSRRIEGLPSDNVGTLHSICFRALGRPALTVAKTKDFNEHFERFRLTAASRDVDDPYSEQQSGQSDGDRLQAQMDVLRATRSPRAIWPPHVQEFSKVWEDWKNECGLLDFTDLLEIALLDVQTAPGNPAVCAVDEAQDCSKLQIDLLLQWGQQMQKLVMVGDDDQVLYEWCGADASVFLDLPIPEENKTVLPQSYRVPRAVHSLASQWIEKSSRRYPKEYRPRDVDGEVSRCNATIRWPEPAIESAEQHLADGKSVMFLASYNQALDSIKNRLRERHIPFHNPYRTKRGDWNPLLPGSKKIVRPVDRVLSLLACDGATWGDNAKEMWTWHELWSWTEPLAASELFHRGFKEWIKDKKGDNEPVNTSELSPWIEGNGAEWLYNLLFSTPEQAKASLNQWLERTLPEKRKVLEYPVSVAMKHGGQKLFEEPKCILGTIHSVKGGQADVVYLFPDVGRPAMRSWLSGGLLRDAVVRMIYVAMTRAREKLVICQAGSPLAVEIAL